MYAWDFFYDKEEKKKSKEKEKKGKYMWWD